jgi:hypothetical protein
LPTDTNHHPTTHQTTELPTKTHKQRQGKGSAARIRTESFTSARRSKDRPTKRKQPRTRASHPTTNQALTYQVMTLNTRNDSHQTQDEGRADQPSTTDNHRQPTTSLLSTDSFVPTTKRTG